MLENRGNIILQNFIAELWILFTSSKLIIDDMYVTVRHVITTATSETIQVGSSQNLREYLSIQAPAFSCGRHTYFQFAVAIRISCTRISFADAKLDALQTWFSTALTDCHRGYIIGSWRSRARFGGKLDSENFDVISRFRDNPLGQSFTEMQIAFSSRSLLLPKGPLQKD